jgi:mannosyl-3-phosphoglycerate phosphatase
VVLTDLDGTLLDASGAWRGAEAALARLRAAGAHVVPVTSKTVAEVGALREAMGLTGPAVVESGSAILVASGASAEAPPGAGQETVRTIEMARPYAETRRALMRLRDLLGCPLVGFGDMPATELATMIEADAATAALAQCRRWSEPFVAPEAVDPNVAASLARDFGFDVLQGDRFWHLVTAGVGKGAAAAELLRHYRSRGDAVPVIALGNGPHDAALLAVADEAFVIPGPSGPHPALTGRGWRVADRSGPQGWGAVVTRWLDARAPHTGAATCQRSIRSSR